MSGLHMATVRHVSACDILAPFLFPCSRSKQMRPPLLRPWLVPNSRSIRKAYSSFTAPLEPVPQSPTTQIKHHDASHLDPEPSSYSLTPFTDRCTLNIHAGAGGHGCVSFLREKYIEQGPPNGGDGGTGGSVYIQAVRGETSLHKIARRGAVKAERGANGQGKNKGGERGEDVLITVPVGTIVRELWRIDPQEKKREEHRERAREMRRLRREGKIEENAENIEPHKPENWISYPGMTPREAQYTEPPRAPRRDTDVLQPKAPIRLDLDEPNDRPILLAGGAVGGLGNPHFVSAEVGRPKFATRGEPAIRMAFDLELKTLADVGLVGLPNAGKSTLLRALSNSRTRVGDWAFTTLQPSIGTVVLDNHTGRPDVRAFEKSGDARSNFTVADIPGIIEDAHMDKGLGLGFLRHVERAAVLAFVIDLSAGDAVNALKALWKEVGEYETMRDNEINAETEARIFDYGLEQRNQVLPSLAPPISSKPWFVVATKADLPETHSNYAALQTYLELLKDDKQSHPSGRQNAWKQKLVVVPVSAIKAEGVERIPRLVVELLG